VTRGSVEGARDQAVGAGSCGIVPRGAHVGRAGHRSDARWLGRSVRCLSPGDRPWVPHPS
jgi:hypothetical protein